MRLQTFVLLLLACLLPEFAATAANQLAVSDIKADEHVVFFRTSAWNDSVNKVWHVPIHGWIYEPEDSVIRKAAFRAVLEKEFDLSIDETNTDTFSKRVNLLIADNERGKRIVINVGDRHYPMPVSAANGHFSGTLTIPESELATNMQDGRLRYFAMSRYDQRRFPGETRLLAERGIAVISDIDDTIKISHVTDRRLLLDYTLLREFAAVPGMAELYQRWATDGAAFHFVSSSPWQLYTPLKEFADEQGFPWASFSLKSVRFRDSSLLNLFKPGTETKPAAIKAIIGKYPDRKFILVGDSGEQDPEVYSALMREFPQQIIAAYIRNVSNAQRDNERFSELFRDIPGETWALFNDAAELPESP